MSFTHIKHAVYGSLVGGVVFGIMMGMMGMLPMIGAMVGSPSAAVGFGVHLVISAAIGIGFAFLVSLRGQKRTAGVTAGLVYGFAWWILGPLTLMPLLMGAGLGTSWTLSAIAGAVPSLFGHLVFGGLLGATYRWLQTDGTAATVVRSRAA